MKGFSIYLHVVAYLLVSSITAKAQNHTNDSLKALLQHEVKDTDRVRVLTNLSYSYAFSYADTGLMYALQALDLSEQLKFDRGIFDAEFAVSASLTTLGNYPLLLSHCFKALAMAKKINNSKSIAFANGMLSECYFNLGDYQTSLQYEQEVLKIVEKSYPDQLYFMWIQLSRIFEGLRQYDSAVKYANQAYAKVVVNSQPNDISLISPILGNALASKGSYDSALHFYHTGIPVAKENHFGTDLIDDYNGIAAVYQTNEKYDSAIWYSKQVLAEDMGKAYPASLLQAANRLADMYQFKKWPDSGLKYLRIANTLKDSLFNREKTVAIQNIKYKEREKQRDIATARSEIVMKFKLYFAISALIIVLTAAFIIFRNGRIRQFQEMRNSIADDLHDDIGSTLSSINILSELAKKKSPESLSLLNSIGENTIAIQENMSDIVWAINPTNDGFEKVLERMKQFAFEILEGRNIELNFESDNPVKTLKLTMERRKNFYLFFKEVINNLAKHSKATMASVHIDEYGNYIEMKVTDNGIGFDKEIVFSGNGMTGLRRRSIELDAVFSIQSAVGQGTVVYLKFKIA